MFEREVNAKEVLNDIVSGVDDTFLREKYRLTPAGLKKLFKTMVDKGLLERVEGKYVIPPRSVSAAKILRDILWGQTGSQLMRKYRLSPLGLQTVLRKLVDARLLDVSELGDELYLRLEATSPENIRQVERIYLDFDVQVFDVEQPETLGLVQDISEIGVGLTGIEAKIGDLKIFVVLGDALGQVGPFQFKAECRWTRTDEPGGEIHSGFRIVEIGPNDAAQLKNLITLASLTC
ncbi:MAG: PilZ domain-containing protein [Deltaproteobacteria bacterium]|nr:PilZ domain-containing protein [Deltaproteobacteria bacterium]